MYFKHNRKIKQNVKNPDQGNISIFPPLAPAIRHQLSNGKQRAVMTNSCCEQSLFSISAQLYHVSARFSITLYK